MKVLILAIMVVILLLIGFCLWMAGFVTKGKRQTEEEAYAWQKERYDVSFYDNLEKEDYVVYGDNRYELHVEFIKNPESSGKYVILSHGYTDNHIGSLKYVQMYMDEGYSCIIYDLRGHGDNKPYQTTYGLLEARDLVCLIKDTRVRYDDLKILGLHGESLGSATTLTSLQYKPEVDFVVADCGFADIENVLRNGYASAHAPEWLFDLADFGVQMRFKMSLRGMRPIDALGENKVPILFIHGDADELITPDNSTRMAERTAGYSEVHLIKGAPHAQSIFTAPQEYKQYVHEFVRKIETNEIK